MKAIRMVDLNSQYQNCKAEMDAAVLEVLHDARFINGPAVERFQCALQDYTGARHVIPCASGTDALMIAMMALGLQPGDEVITVPFTFVATAETAALLRLKPVFVDVRPDTFNMDADKIEQSITPKTKAIVPVHLFGQCADMEIILKIAQKNHLFVIEDACQAIGSVYTFSDGTQKQVGTMGDIGCTSFFPSKNLGCYGDGGAMFTNDDALAATLKQMATHGASQKYHYDRIGVNSRLDTLQAAILEVKLKYLDGYVAARRRAAEYYTAHLSDCQQIVTPVTADFSTHVFHQYTIRCKNNSRLGLMEKLKAEHISSAIYYPLPLHLQRAYRYLNHQKGDFPVSEQLAESVLSLPMHTELEKDQLEFIVQIIKQHFSR